MQGRILSDVRELFRETVFMFDQAGTEARRVQNSGEGVCVGLEARKSGVGKKPLGERWARTEGQTHVLHQGPQTPGEAGGGRAEHSRRSHGSSRGHPGGRGWVKLHLGIWAVGTSAGWVVP